MAHHETGWAIIGCGRVVERRIAPAMKRLSGAGLVGFCSRDLTRAAAFAGRHDAPRAYGSLREVLSDDSVQAVYIATPNVLHADQAEACLAAGRHVMCDKPLALRTDDVRRLIKDAERGGLALGVMHQQRFHPANLHLIRLMDQGTLGRLTVARAQIGIWYPPCDNWRLDPAMSGGGAVMDLAPHVLDIMLQVGGPVSRVHAWTGNLRFDYPVEDFGQVRLEFQRGGVALIDMSYCTHAYGGRVEVDGSAGMFVAEGTLQMARVYRTSLRLGEASSPAQTVEDSYQDNFIAALQDFGDAVREHRPPTVSGADALAVGMLIDAIYRSARTGKTVTLAAH